MMHVHNGFKVSLPHHPAHAGQFSHAGTEFRIPLLFNKNHTQGIHAVNFPYGGVFHGMVVMKGKPFCRYQRQYQNRGTIFCQGDMQGHGFRNQPGRYHQQ